MERIKQIGNSTALTRSATSLEKQVSPSRTQFLKTALAKFAVLRADVMPGELLESYSKALCEFPDDSDTMAVLDKLVKSPRAEFEPKIPELGMLLGVIRARRSERKRKEEQDQREKEWADYCAQVALERAEEEKLGPRVLTEQEERLERILATARHDKRKVSA